MRASSPSSLFVFFAASVLSAPALAQSADSIKGTDSSRVVQAGRRRQLLAPVVVTGSLSDAAPEKLGIARGLIDRSQLRAEPSRAAVDPLRRATGAFIDEANGALGPTIIRLRGGEETFTQVLVDGVQANENGGFFDWQGLTLVNIDRIELARGPQSALYGTSAMSGVVQLFTQAGEPGRPRVEATLEGAGRSATGGGARGVVEASGGSDAVRYAAGVGSAYERGPYKVPHDLHANDVSLRVDLVPSGPFQVTTVARYMGIDSKLPVRDAGVSRVPLDPNQRNSRDRVIAAVHGIWSASERWTHRVSLADYHQDFTYIDGKDDIDGSAYPFFVFDANFHYRAVVDRQTARYIGTVNGARTRALAYSASFGGQWERESLETEASGDFGPATQDVSRPSVAGFAEAQARFAERISVLAGTRVEKFRGLDAAFVPRATMVVDVLRDRLALRAAVGRAYKAPNLQDQFPNNPFIVGNPDLAPETSVSSEFGADLTWSHASASLTYFRQRYDNLIRSVDYDASGRQINRNLGRSRATGFEAELGVRPHPRWSLGASGSWTNTRVLDNRGLPSDQFPAGEALPFRPNYTASVYAGLPLAKKVSVVLRSTSIGRQTVLSERFSGARRSIDPYTVLSATGTFGIAPSLDAYLHAENVLDTQYDTGYDRPGAPRSAALGIRVRR